MTKYTIYNPDGTLHGDMEFPGTIVPAVAPPPAADVWQANYYRGLDPTGTVLFSTTYPGPALELNWQAGSPNPAVPVDGFSAIFVCTHVFNAGTWQWKVRSDDGFELSVDDVVVPGLSGWIQQSAASKEYAGQVTLTAGTHTIKVRYFENGGLAELHISAPTPF